MTAIIHTCITGSIDSYKVHTINEVKVKVLATVAKSKPFLLAMQIQFLLAFGYVANR